MQQGKGGAGGAGGQQPVHTPGTGLQRAWLGDQEGKMENLGQGEQAGVVESTCEMIAPLLHQQAAVSPVLTLLLPKPCSALKWLVAATAPPGQDAPALAIAAAPARGAHGMG